MTTATTDQEPRIEPANSRQQGFRSRAAYASLAELPRRIGFGDLVLLPYLAVFVRSYLWIVGDDLAAWWLTAAFAFVLWCGYIALKDVEEERLTSWFWLIVALPLAVIYALRIAFPDLSYDVLNYRHVHGERGLRGFPFMPGDFFPTIFPLNPAPDMLTGIYRHLLGYRLGTIGNLLSLLWTGEILSKFLRPVIDERRVRCLCVLLILLTEQILFEINNYMVDVLALPLLLEATRFVVAPGRFRPDSRLALRLGFLLGAAVAFKLTNIIYVVPLAGAAAWRVFAAGERLTRRVVWQAVCFGITFVLPSLVHAVWIYRETGSPVFPLYNNIFRSPYWLPHAVYDPRWGPQTWWESLVWSVSMISRPERASEIAVYSGRLPLGVLAALACCFVAPRDRGLRAAAVVLLVGALLWSGTTGYIRYGLFLEVLAGVVIVMLCRRLLLTDDRIEAFPLRRVSGALLAALFVTQCAAAVGYGCSYEWAYRPTLLTRPADFLAESRNLLRDHDALRFLTPEARVKLETVKAWVVSDVRTNGVEVLLKPDVPMISVQDAGYFQTEAANRRFDRTLEQLAGRKLCSLAFSENIDAALANLRRGGLKAESIRPFEARFFSPAAPLDMRLIEVRRMREDEMTDVLADQPLRRADAAPEPLDAAISLLDHPSRLRAGETATLRIRIENVGTATWGGAAETGAPKRFRLGNHWLDRFGRKLINDDGRSSLPNDLAPGASAELPLTITAPTRTGDYILEIDIVQEGVGWFRDNGSRTVRVKMTIRDER